MNIETLILKNYNVLKIKPFCLRPDRDDYVNIIFENVEIAAKGQMKIRKNYNDTYDESGGNIYFNSLRN